MNTYELAEYIEQNIGSQEMWERGDTEVSWKDKTCYDWPSLFVDKDNKGDLGNSSINSTYYEMAKDILVKIKEAK